VSADRTPIVLMICGYKKSGKTTLIEQLAHELTGRGLRVLAVKRAGRALEAEPPGKDSARFFAAGADVAAYDGEQLMLRRHARADLAEALERAGAGCDVALVEGHKTEDPPEPYRAVRVWLLRAEGENPPEDLQGLRAALPPGPERLEQALAIVETQLAANA